jgi:hypothetical protein
MPSATFRRLIDELCHLSKLPNPQALYERAALSIDGVDTSLVEREGQINEVIIHCDFGALPTRRRDEVLLRLLEINFNLFIGSASPSCTVNQQTGRATLAAVAPLPGLTALALLELLGQLADMAKVWRQGYFLEATPARAGVNRGVAR